jgi:hypothetical protein
MADAVHQRGACVAMLDKNHIVAMSVVAVSLSNTKGGAFQVVWG